MSPDSVLANSFLHLSEQSFFVSKGGPVFASAHAVPPVLLCVLSASFPGEVGSHTCFLLSCSCHVGVLETSAVGLRNRRLVLLDFLIWQRPGPEPCLQHSEQT